MNSIRPKATIIWGASIAGALLLFAAFFGIFNSRAGASNESGRLITIYDRGEEKVILSDGKTIAEALADAKITVDSRDAVEPALDEKLVASEYHINIYRARPVTVIDGATRQKVVTAYQTADQIVKDTGITLYPEDLTEMARSNDILSDGAGLQLTIDRATPVTLNLYGEASEVRTQGSTVAEFLEEKGIVLGESDRASIPLTSSIASDTVVRIWREGKQTITVQEKLDFPIEEIKDADRPIGYKEVRTAGVAGERKVTYEIEIKDGQEVSRQEIATITTVEPQKQIEVIGAKVQLLVGYSADKAAIMTEAGVAASDQDYAAYIINNENAGWCAIRWQGTSGCWASYAEKFPGSETSSQVGYGLCQSTPGIKMQTAGADWRTNVVTQMKWCHSYAISRYGSWEAAYSAKVSKGWW